MSDVLSGGLSPQTPVLGPAGEPLADTAATLRWLRSGLSEETMRLELPPDIRSNISPIITALRWGALLYGMVQAASLADQGELGVVVTLSIALFLTVWRTFRPLRLAWKDLLDRTLPIIDGIILGGAAGVSSGFDSPFIFCLLVAIGVASFGWGLLNGLWGLLNGLLTILAALIAMAVVSAATGGPLNLGDVGGIAFLIALLAVAALVALVRDNLINRQREQVALSSRVDMLSETNEMLGILNQVARTLPESMDLREAANATTRELTTQFRANTIGLLVRDDATSEWLPMITEGIEFNDSVATSRLPTPMQQALLQMSTLSNRETDNTFISSESSSGLYTALRARGKVVGLLAVESERTDDYTEREVRILEGLSGALALTIDNVRSFGRLRTIGADQERTRIARDLHDRLGQWLTYISLELERIMNEVSDPTSLQALYGDVQTAIDELRETLRQLRTRVSEEDALATVGASMVTRFTERTGIVAKFSATNPDEALLVSVENELLRILQESLNNVEKHAEATEVNIVYTAKNGEGEMVINDNGRGFDTTGGRRETSYGLVGMRERADVIGATLSIDSRRGHGTTVRVRASNELSV